MNALLRTMTVLSIAMSVALHAGTASAQASDPEQVVRTFMKEFYSDDVAGDFRKPASARRYFTPSSAKAAIAQSKQHIDADFIVDGQDYVIKNLQFSKHMKNKANAIVTVKFDNFGQKIIDNFGLSLTNGRWLIDDVCRPDRSCLLGKGF